MAGAVLVIEHAVTAVLVIELCPSGVLVIEFPVLQSRSELETILGHRISMAYRRFPNVRDLYRGDLDSKLNKGLTSEEVKPRACNCIAPNKRDGKCVYGEECRVPCVIYKIKCRHCKKFYIGNTSDHFKSRVAGHCSDACSVLNKVNNQRSTACSRHFIKHIGISHPDGPPYGSSF